jgi:hypothetical protein
MTAIFVKTKRMEEIFGHVVFVLFALGCDVAHRVRRDSLGCDVGLLVARRLAVRRARVRIPARRPREVFATELFSDDGMERSLGECLWM